MLLISVQIANVTWIPEGGGLKIRSTLSLPQESPFLIMFNVMIIIMNGNSENTICTHNEV